MQIYVRARTFFEAARGSWKERHIFRTSRIISINSVSFPAEPPPFSDEFLHAENLLVLYFDDVDEGQPHAMTPEQAKQIVDFVRIEDPRPIFVHCTAGISRSGAVGEVLNWYFNRYLEDNSGDYQLFQHMHRDLVPNAHVRRLLLKDLERRHTSMEEMKQLIRLRQERKRLLHNLAAVWAEKLLDPRLKKWFAAFDCLRFSEKLVRGNPKIIKYAEAKFLRSGCGTAWHNDEMLVVDIEGEGKMRQVFAQMLELAEPESYEFKGENTEDFFAPFMPAIKAVTWSNSKCVLRLLRNSPKDAAVFLLAQRRWKSSNLFGKMSIDHNAQKFDKIYAEYVTGKSELNPAEGKRS